MATPATNEAIITALNGIKPEVVAPPAFRPFRPTGDRLKDAKQAKQYLEDFTQACDAYKIENKLNAFKLVCGEAVNKLLKITAVPAEARTKSDWEKALAKFSYHYLSQDLSTYYRTEFNKAWQKRHEDSSAYLFRLTELVTECKFLDSTDADQVEEANQRALIAQVAQGAKNTKLRDKAFDEDVTWNDLLKLAMKLDTRDAQKSAIDGPSGLINKIFQPNPRRKNYSGYSKPARDDSDCNYCGNGSHDQSKCPAKGQTCAACGRLNHLKPVCKSGHKPWQKPKKSRHVNKIEEDSTVSETETETSDHPEPEEYQYSSDSSYDTDDMTACIIRHVNKQA